MLRSRNPLTSVIVLIRKTRRVHMRDSDAFNRFPHCKDWTDSIKEYGADLFQKVRNDMEIDKLNSVKRTLNKQNDSCEKIHIETAQQVPEESRKIAGGNFSSIIGTAEQIKQWVEESEALSGEDEP